MKYSLVPSMILGYSYGICFRGCIRRPKHPPPPQELAFPTFDICLALGICPLWSKILK